MDDERFLQSKTDQLTAILDQDAAMDVDDDPDASDEDVSTIHVRHTPKKMKVNDVAVEGMCVECEDQPFAVKCEQCFDLFCDVCFLALHRKGQRTTHVPQKVENNSPAAIVQAQRAAAAAAEKKKTVAQSAIGEAYEEDEEENSESIDEENRDEKFKRLAIQKPLQDMTVTELGAWYTERAQYIPLRLSFEERKLLRLIQAALNVSDYTDKVDIISYTSKPKRMAAQLKEICAILTGLAVANDYNRGQQLIKDKNFADLSEHFKNIFEIGRRHKIMNPEKMRGEYGKLVYMLQDSMSPHVQDLLQFECVQKIRTVHSLLAERGALGVLSDQYIAVATREIVADGKSRQQVQREIREKERAQEYIASKYSNSQISDEDIKLCLYSIGDNHSYLRGNRDPVDKMIRFLTTYFSPNEVEEGFSLAVQAGMGGARLTHNHTRQYHYVLQSLMLWREILHDMFKLWYLCEEDLLDGSNFYRLTDTGQGLNRVQHAPRIGKAIHRILHSVQSRVDAWVGSSVVHLGDHNVPNALMFIDKYNQVSRILNPIVLCVEKVDDLYRDPKIRNYIDSSFGSIDNCRKEILSDFFRHGFDGSGADNFFDAGSCIDGRLTSAWNWCSKVEKKRYFPIFLLSGFVGFDGQFA